ncbi:fumarylacetoacetate hydrolase family protein [Ideonella sp. B7]|uniref:fumarylacetoacetate hydrolase family protein n=1 Tax=Ideonella benzenivorans TaxID=2831643 RepID=UPI001CEC9198|nr:fumarylacetoacetate hydrolase family protein [Ideonella benzenivorans]MCA6215455.1 fumarylacetoacetate hydrolase family protein [Ideonella benzenivorans]
MKLATYQDGSRDGQLVVVSRDLRSAHFASGIATRLQQVLDDWGFLAPQLEDLSRQLNHGKARHAFAFDPAQCLAPLPRSGQWVRSRAYRAQLALGWPDGAVPEAALAQPWLEPGTSDGFTGPTAELAVDRLEDGPDFGAQWAVITGDLARGAPPAQALEAVRLLALANDWTLRGPEAEERQRGAGRVLSCPATAFAPVAVTPDELGEGWQAGVLRARLQVQWNGRALGPCDTGTGLAWHMGQLLAQLARHRPVKAGTVVGSGPVADGTGQGVASLAALPEAPAGLQFGDTVRIELTGPDGPSVFGAITQTVVEVA